MQSPAVSGLNVYFLGALSEMRFAKGLAFLDDAVHKFVPQEPQRLSIRHYLHSKCPLKSRSAAQRNRVTGVERALARTRAECNAERGWAMKVCMRTALLSVG